MLGAVHLFNQNGTLPATPTKFLTIDGLSVLKSSTAPNSYGVDVESVTVTEAGSGQVSSMTFTILDPAAEIVLTPGQYVRFHDVTLDLPIFVGFIESFSMSRFGIGRYTEVTCIGIETVLDWMYVPATTFCPGILTGVNQLNDMYQSAIGTAVGIGVQLRAFQFASALNSNQAFPVGIGPLGGGTGGCVWGGGSLRQALTAINDYIVAQLASAGILVAFGILPPTLVCTVDFYHGVRIAWAQLPSTSSGLNDYTSIALSTGAAPRPSVTGYGSDSSGATAAVYVLGSGNGTGVVGGGTGIPGPIAVLSDANSTTADYRNQIGLTYLNATGIAVVVTVTAEGGVSMNTVGAQKRANSLITVTDGVIPGGSYTNVVREIVKTYAASGEETWAMTFGGTVPKASAYMRQLTKSSLV